MNLNILWFILIAVLWIVFFVLEGFDFGVGILLPFLGKNDTERRTIINTIGPHWDGNEVWLLTAGGATFAAFPQWYATLFSGFYLPLFVVLVGLILRGVALEFRSKDEAPLWRKVCDWCIFAGSLIPALLFGVAFANLAQGIPIDQNMQYVGGFFNLLNLYALLGGITMVVICALHGAIYLGVKTTGGMQEKALKAAWRLWIPALVVSAAFIAFSYLATDILKKVGIDPGPIPVISGVALLASGWLVRRKQPGWAFLATSLGIATSFITFFIILFPNVLISSLDPAYNMTIYTASSSQLTLTIMTIVAAIFVPIVLAYQAWSYWLFRQPVEGKAEKLTY